MKGVIWIIIIIVTIILMQISYYLGSRVTYHTLYKNQVKKTIRENVKKECLKEDK